MACDRMKFLTIRHPWASLKVRPIFAWFDLWVGVFIDRPNRRVYIFPIPCFGIVVERRKRKAVKS